MKKIIIPVLAAFALFTSCDLATDVIYPEADYLVADPAGGEYPVGLYATGPWDAVISATDDLKMSVTPASGEGSCQITISVLPYEGELDYALGYVVFACGKARTSFPVYQLSEEFKKQLQEQNQQFQGD